MGEWFLALWIGAALTSSTTTGTWSNTRFHHVGPLTEQACAQVRNVLKDAQNVIRAECLVSTGMASGCIADGIQWAPRGDGICYMLDRPH